MALYGPSIFTISRRRRLPQDEDAADVMQEVLSAVLNGSYQRPKGRFQKWLLTILLNEIRDFHNARARRGQVLAESPGRRRSWTRKPPAPRRNGKRSGVSIFSVPPPTASANDRILRTGTSSCARRWITKPARRSLRNSNFR